VTARTRPYLRVSVRSNRRSALPCVSPRSSASFQATIRRGRDFKPEGLCREIDQLLADFQNHFKGVKYLVHLFSIGEIRDTLRSMGNYDQALYHQYDRFMSELSNLAVAIELASKKERAPLVEAVRSAIAKLEADLKESVKSMRAAKDRVVNRM